MNHFTHSSAVVSCALVLGAMVGCSSEGGTVADGAAIIGAASDADYKHVAQLLATVATADTQGGELGSVSDATSIVLGTPRLALHAKPDASFIVTRCDANHRYEADCSVEGAGNACGEASDANVSLSLAGTFAADALDAVVEHDASLTFFNLHNDIVNASGHGASEIDVTFHDAAPTSDDTGVDERGDVAVVSRYHVSHQVSYDTLRIASYSMGVLGGRAHYDMVIERMEDDGSESGATVDESFAIEATLEFFEDQTGVLTLDGTHQYRIDPRYGVLYPFENVEPPLLE